MGASYTTQVINLFNVRSKKITPQADVKFATSNNITSKNKNSNISFNKLKEHSSETLDSTKKL